MHLQDDDNLFNGASDTPKLELSQESLKPVEAPSVPKPSKPLGSKKAEELEALGGDLFLEVSVTEPHKVGDGMGSYLAYKVITKTNMKFFRKTNFTVVRRFSDFLGLHDKLVEKYLKTGRIIPPAPEKSVIGTLSQRQ